MKTLEDALIENGQPHSGLSYPCSFPDCSFHGPAFALVSGKRLGHIGWICGQHFIDSQREVDNYDYSSELWYALKQERNNLINSLLWTTTDTSPLTEECKQKFRERIEFLHSLTVSFPVYEEAREAFDSLEPIIKEYK